MIIRVHKKSSSFGHSFKGLGEYLLHDKDARTTDRVAWTETRNLATNDPEMACRVMAATAMDADRLKAQAGVKNTGRKSTASVMHFAISWTEDEREELTREKMMSAADTVLANLGKDTSKSKKNGRSQFADEHQILVVCHSDSKNPHVHVVVNRVHPEHGVMLPSSNDFLKASKVALEYEQKTGRIRCANRAINWEARDRGEYVRDNKSIARNIYEQRKAASKAQAPELDKKAQLEKKKDAEVGRKARETKKRHQMEMAAIAEGYKSRIADLEAETKKKVAKAKHQVREKFRPEWENRYHERQEEFQQFEKDEEKFLGRIKNAAKAIDFKAIFTGKDRRRALSDSFDAFSSSGAREQAVKRQQGAKDAELQKRQQAAEQAASLPSQEQEKKVRIEVREKFLAKRSELLLAHRMDRAAERAGWATRHNQRKEAYLAVGQNPEAGSGLTAAKQEKLDRAREAARRIEGLKARQKDQSRDQDRSRGRGR